MTLTAEAFHRSTGGARIVLKDERNVPVGELVLDSAPLAVQALEALAGAMGGGLQYGVMLTHPGGTEQVIEHRSAPAAERAAKEMPEKLKIEIVRRAVGVWLTAEEREAE
jgi:hypothetical protein